MVLDLRATTIAYPGYKTHWGIEQYLFSAQGNDLQHSRKADKIDRSGFGTRVRNSEPGMQDGSLKIKGLATMDKGTLNWQLNQWFGRKSPVNAWYALEGLSALSPITMQPSSIIDASISSKLKDAVDFDLELDARGAFDDGVILLSPEDLLTGSSGTGLLDDNTLYGGATSTGAAAQLHVWALDGGTNPTVTVTIQHSVDGTSWTNLISFPAMSAVGSKRIDLPYPSLVNKKVQAIWTTSGTPTDVQVLLGFARGIDLEV
jgi:hypothetical protein